MLIVTISKSALSDEKSITSNEKLNYAWAASTAIESVQNNVKLDQNTYMIGVRDAESNFPPALTEKESAALFQQQMSQIRANRHVQQQKMENEFKQHDNTIAALAQKRPALKITDSGLMYEIIKIGAGTKPTFTDKVKISYVVRDINNLILHDSSKHTAKGFLNVYLLDIGISEAVQHMPKGSKWRLYLPSNKTLQIDSSRYGLLSLYEKRIGAVIIDLQLNDIAPN